MLTETKIETRLAEDEIEQQRVRDFIDELAARIVKPPTGQEIVEVNIIRHSPSENELTTSPDHEVRIRQLLSRSGKLITEFFASSKTDANKQTIKGSILGDSFPNPGLTYTSGASNLTGLEAMAASEMAINAGDFPILKK